MTFFMTPHNNPQITKLSKRPYKYITHQTPLFQPKKIQTIYSNNNLYLITSLLSQRLEQHILQKNMALVLRKPYAYAKIDKEDPEEIKRRRAQFLIYKVMERADSTTRRRPSYLRFRIRKLKVKIGKRLTKLRKTMMLTMSAAIKLVSAGKFVSN